jgi:hypothetical protein
MVVGMLVLSFPSAKIIKVDRGDDVIALPCCRDLVLAPLEGLQFGSSHSSFGQIPWVIP